MELHGDEQSGYKCDKVNLGGLIPCRKPENLHHFKGETLGLGNKKAARFSWRLQKVL